MINPTARNSRTVVDGVPSGLISIALPENPEKATLRAAGFPLRLSSLRTVVEISIE